MPLPGKIIQKAQMLKELETEKETETEAIRKTNEPMPENSSGEEDGLIQFGGHGEVIFDDRDDSV